MKVALAQVDPTVGDIEGNADRIIDLIEDSRAVGAHLVITPELAVFGYPPKDLMLRKDLVLGNVEAVRRVASHCVDVTAIVGYVQPNPGGTGNGAFNAAAICRNGTVEASYSKMLLPTYDIFDECRYFDPGQDVCAFTLAVNDGCCRVGLTICEDLWHDRQFEGRRVYGKDPIEQTVRAGADLLVNLSASPYRVGVQQEREDLFAAQAREHGVNIICVNQVGGNDDLIFDGASLVLDRTGAVAARANSFAEDLMIVDLASPAKALLKPYPGRIDAIRSALVLGLRDYVRKCGFERVVVGLSGGVDSALTAALAVEAIGAQRVQGVAMPSRFSSSHSVEDAQALTESLGLQCMTIPIEGVHSAFERALRPHFGDRPPDIAEENIQARVRGSLLMALSNKFGWLLLTTGNKSELAVGYCTLYGDMCGGLAVLSDVPKTIVFDLARRINESAGRPLIPTRTIEKPPSAELRENQLDEDSLPPYDVLDPILEQYVERDLPTGEIVKLGFDRKVVQRVAEMVDQNEYKRKQTPVGLKVTSRAFGTGRRMPIAARYH